LAVISHRLTFAPPAGTFRTSRQSFSIIWNRIDGTSEASGKLRPVGVYDGIGLYAWF
jgi:hypothetical protein